MAFIEVVKSFVGESFVVAEPSFVVAETSFVEVEPSFVEVEPSFVKVASFATCWFAEQSIIAIAEFEVVQQP